MKKIINNFYIHILLIIIMYVISVILEIQMTKEQEEAKKQVKEQKEQVKQGKEQEFNREVYKYYFGN